MQTPSKTAYLLKAVAASAAVFLLAGITNTIDEAIILWFSRSFL